ncbi:thiamine diphosphokinase [Haloimpatiens sp. FM7330]|uniref:thiamine diphosphokinase n=1 Tax=Haloimpatiens sp. FM7330 TaxID=3298610 RepID=UPI0036361F8F
MKIVIISGGKAPSEQLLRKEIKNSNFIICADSGANCLYEYRICPDLLLGDFDSINEDVLKDFKKGKCKIIQHPTQKDFTDSESALNEAIRLKPNEIVLLGFTGTRIDHMLGNLGLLIKCLKLDIKAYIKDEHNIITLVNKGVKLQAECGTIVSFQAYSDIVENLSIKGAKYPLCNYDLRLGDSLTVSNEFLHNEISVDFSSGNLLIILAKD